MHDRLLIVGREDNLYVAFDCNLTSVSEMSRPRSLEQYNPARLLLCAFLLLWFVTSKLFRSRFILYSSMPLAGLKIFVRKMVSKVIKFCTTKKIDDCSSLCTTVSHPSDALDKPPPLYTATARPSAASQPTPADSFIGSDPSRTSSMMLSLTPR